MNDGSESELSRRISWEAAKNRVLSILMEGSKRSETGLSNQEIRKITHFDRFQAISLMKELMGENSKIKNPDRGKYAKYSYTTFDGLM